MAEITIHAKMCSYRSLNNGMLEVKVGVHSYPYGRELTEDLPAIQDQVLLIKIAETLSLRGRVESIEMNIDDSIITFHIYPSDEIKGIQFIARLRRGRRGRLFQIDIASEEQKQGLYDGWERDFCLIVRSA